MDEYTRMLAEATKDIECNLTKAPAYRRRAILKMENEDYKGAIDDLTMALRFRYRHANTWYYRGRCFNELKMHLAAMSDYQMALKFRPNKSAVWCEMGNVMLTLNDLERADEYYSRALKINRLHYDSLVLRGYTRLKTGKPAKALTDLNRAYRIDAFNPQGLKFRAMALESLERWEEALEDYDISIALLPEASAYLNRAVVRYNLEQYTEALADAKQALAMEPEWDECYEVIDEIEEEMDY